MNPYYDRDGITIYHGDCFALNLELQSVAAFIMDPPYASGTRHEATKPLSGAMVRGGRFAERPIDLDQMTTTGFVWLMREIARFARPTLIDGGHFLSFIDWRQWPNLVGAIETANLRVNQMVVWDKQHFGMGWSFRNQHELILAASKGVPRMADRGVGSVLSFPRPTNDWHPSPKPVELIRRLIEATTEPDELVVDPFAGSAPIAEACRDLGRRYVGVEIEERYCEIAVQRLAQQVLPLEVG